MKIGKFNKHDKKPEENWACIGFNLRIVADRIQKYLKKGEIIEVDWNLPTIPGNLEDSVEELKDAGLDLGKKNQQFGYLIYPLSQPITEERRLFVYQRN